MKKFLFGIALLFVTGNLMAQEVADRYTFRYHNDKQTELLALEEGSTTQIVIGVDSRTSNTYVGTQFDLILPKGYTVPKNAVTGAYRIFKMGDVADKKITYYDEDSEEDVTIDIVPFNVQGNILTDDNGEVLRDEEGNSTFRVMIFQTEELNQGEFFRFPESSNDFLRVVIQAEAGKSKDICPIRIKNGVLSISANEPCRIPTSGFVSYAVDESGFSTLSLNEALDFSAIDLKAYVLNELSTSFASLTEVEKVPAATPIVIQGAAGSYTLPLLEGDADAISTNMLSGTTLAEYTVEDGSTYAIATKTPGTGFYRCKTGVVIPQYKAYLKNSSATNESYLFEGITGISKVENEKVNGDIYTITGVKVNDTAQKGIYIQNGKKVIVK